MVVIMQKITNFRQPHSQMKQPKTAWIIHGFALLHAAVSSLCYIAGVGDSLLLTLLTMAMTVIICISRSLTVEFTAFSVILVNIAGFVLGSIGADLFGLFTDSPAVIHAAATFLSTEILGWLLVLISRSFPRIDEGRSSWRSGLGWLVAAFLVVFLLRVSVDFLFSSGFYEGVNVTEMLSGLLKNTLSLILTVSCTFLFIRFTRREDSLTGISFEKRIGRTGFLGLTAAFILAMAALGASFEGWGIPFRLHGGLTLRRFLQLLILSLLIELTVYAVMYMLIYAAEMRERMVRERERTHLAEYRYMALKQQVNPHFLFNSLNILDNLISEGSREDASQYVHRLAGMYRYMLQHESLKTVRISEEAVFLKMYEDLLSVRFPEGFSLDFSVREEDMGRGIVPCTLQLLVENAFKHNAISPDNPLRIKIFSDGQFLYVENDIIPKMRSTAPSTGLGIKYIRQQYKDIAGKEATVGEDSGTFRAKLPLL